MADLFKDKTESMPKEPGRSTDFMIFGSAESRQQPVAVATCMTKDQHVAVLNANYPRWDWGDVKNLNRPKFGHHY